MAQWGRLSGETVQFTDGMGGSVIGETAPLSEVKLLAPAQPSKIICVGRNYADHIKEMGHDMGDFPKEPGLFLKGPNTLTGPNSTVNYPDWTQNFHFEGELAIVIGRTVKNLVPEEALDAVLGYTCALDLTARDLQKTDLQWFRAKSADQFCPLGPWLETDLDPTDLQIQTRVNGVTKQSSRTSHMIFDVVQILTYVSRFVTLQAGDLLLTGTPEGVGALASGDELEVEIQGIGTLEARIG